ncbi:MAG: tetraacyldisaccharide 4'-kinase, partial [Beijerinckiaceae bacterium]
MSWRAPKFWYDQTGDIARDIAIALTPLGKLYGALTAWRMRRLGTRVEKPVICVGNFTVGGAGKTPTVIALCRMLQQRGEIPFVVSRGYGGKDIGPLRVDPHSHKADRVGDEPLEIERHAPVIVARDRVAGARLAIAQGATVIVLDDGLQNPGLMKDLPLAVIDGEALFGNGRCFPAGPLRAPLKDQWPQVRAAIAIGGDGSFDMPKPVLRARLVPDPRAAEALQGVQVLAFAGIGRPEKFFATVERCGARITERRDFGDHHDYSDDELLALAAHCVANGLYPVTTVKDAVRIGGQRADVI